MASLVLVILAANVAGELLDRLPACPTPSGYFVYAYGLESFSYPPANTGATNRIEAKLDIMIDHSRLNLPPLALLLFFSISLAAKPRFPPPAPRYEVRLQAGTSVPMRDGVKLATDLYFPVGVEKNLPAVMIRTPYNRKSQATAANLFAGQGFVTVVQDVRGKFDSEGIFTVSANDTRDGSDLIDWIAAQPWSTGKVGTYGCSYVGEDQIELSKVRNPHQSAMIAQAAGGAYRYAGLMTGGALELAMASEWFYGNGSKREPRASFPPSWTRRRCGGLCP